MYSVPGALWFSFLPKKSTACWEGGRERGIEGGGGREGGREGGTEGGGETGRGRERIERVREGGGEGEIEQGNLT